jgi:hypothetical protein
LKSDCHLKKGYHYAIPFVYEVLHMFSMIFLIALIGLGVVAALGAVVVVVVISRREDFVNPFANRAKPAPPPPAPDVRPVPSSIPTPPPATKQEAALVDWLLAQASAQTGIQLSGDPTVRDRLRNAAHLALQALELEDTAHINLPFLAADAHGPKHFAITVTRAMVEQLGIPRP